MQQGICNPEFYGNLVYNFKKIIGNPNFSDLFKRIANRFKRAGYTVDIMQQAACLVFNPTVVEKSNRKTMNRNWSNQKTNAALKTKTGIN